MDEPEEDKPKKKKKPQKFYRDEVDQKFFFVSQDKLQELQDLLDDRWIVDQWEPDANGGCWILLERQLPKA